MIHNIQIKQDLIFNKESEKSLERKHLREVLKNLKTRKDTVAALKKFSLNYRKKYSTDTIAIAPMDYADLSDPDNLDAAQLNTGTSMQLDFSVPWENDGSGTTIHFKWSVIEHSFGWWTVYSYCHGRTDGLKFLSAGHDKSSLDGFGMLTWTELSTGSDYTEVNDYYTLDDQKSIRDNVLGELIVFWKGFYSVRSVDSYRVYYMP